METPDQLKKRMAEDPKRKRAEYLSGIAATASILAQNRNLSKYHAEAAQAHSEASVAWNKTDYFDTKKKVTFHDQNSMQFHARAIDKL